MNTTIDPVVLFVSEVAPADTSASSVVVHRHLRSLESAGFKICVVTLAKDGLDHQFPKSWQKILLPLRRFYYPPFRPNAVLRAARWHIFDRIVLPELKHKNISCVIGLLAGEYLVSYASWLSTKLTKPLFYFYHDRGELLQHAANPLGAERMKRLNLGLLRSAQLRKVWTVAPELIYEEHDIVEKFKVVYPLPEPLNVPQPHWRPEWKQIPVLVHLGTIYREIVPSFRLICQQLRDVGGRLMLFSHFSETAELLVREFPDIVSYPGFVLESKSLFERVVADGTAFVIVYPNQIQDMPWSLDCFPSKFTQAVQTGLPGIVFAPSQTSIGRWCRHRAWRLYYSSVDEESVRVALNVISCEAGWSSAAAASRKAADGIFNPAALEAQVIDDVSSATSV